ncbi:DUF2799 domain-containing protein [Vibrio barjaei]|jgi:hypothetical protein|uniref:DUF2799 domain-containing protein n=1 Tax=Vibrio barjaei TaxID=1676683 RepID=A0ABW7IKI3_9VIBR|nr:DUF2799 domain-containing protein [Vibrio barjaei]MCY9869412.1 DUF2799 domain-containing protein [Vibrio barjaei]
MNIKFLVSSLITVVFMSGCTQTAFPTDGTSDSWQTFGYEQSKKGYMKKTPEELSVNDAALETAYSKGYEKGRIEYCAQDAYKLGIMGKSYLGICDDLDWRFRMKYNDGRSNQSLGRL